MLGTCRLSLKPTSCVSWWDSQPTSACRRVRLSRRGRISATPKANGVCGKCSGTSRHRTGVRVQGILLQSWRRKRAPWLRPERLRRAFRLRSLQSCGSRGGIRRLRKVKEPHGSATVGRRCVAADGHGKRQACLGSGPCVHHGRSRQTSSSDPRHAIRWDLRVGRAGRSARD